LVFARQEELTRAYADEEPEISLDKIKNSIPNMKESEIVIAVFLQSDGTLKRRPALVLREIPLFRDFLICGISTQLRPKVRDFDEIISEVCNA
jgi:hypothetical protein